MGGWDGEYYDKREMNYCRSPFFVRITNRFFFFVYANGNVNTFAGMRIGCAAAEQNRASSELYLQFAQPLRRENNNLTNIF